jgi:hypothetical protein
MNFELLPILTDYEIRKLNEQIKFYGTTLSESFMCEIIDIRNLLIFLKIYCDEGLSTIFPLICIQTSYDQNVQLILKSYLPVVYGTTLNSWYSKPCLM